jgi:hypothetical protein
MLKDWNVLWRMDPLLGRNIETNNETTAVAMQWRNKHVSTTIKLETVFSTRFVQRGCKEDNWGGRNIGQGEARHRKYKRLKLSGCQAYDRSSE